MIGLHITNCQAKKIRANPHVTEEKKRMRSSKLLECCPFPVASLSSTNLLKMAHLSKVNFRGVLVRTKHIAVDDDLKEMDVLCFSETWLERQHTVLSENLPTNNPQIFRLNRYAVPQNANLAQGGAQSPRVTRAAYRVTRAEHSIPFLEAGSVRIHPAADRCITIIIVYRRPQGEDHMGTFQAAMDQILHLNPTDHTIIVGDFNCDGVARQPSKPAAVHGSKRFYAACQATNHRQWHVHRPCLCQHASTSRCQNMLLFRPPCDALEVTCNVNQDIVLCIVVWI